MATTPSTSKTTKPTAPADPAPDEASTSSTTSAPLAADPGPTPVELRPDGLSRDIPMDGGRIVPTPGDPRTEPVATARESHVAGRVGPATIAEDVTAPWHPGSDEHEPGAVRTDTAEGDGPVPVPLSADPVGDHLAALSERLDADQAVKVQGPVQPNPERDLEVRRAAQERARS